LMLLQGMSIDFTLRDIIYVFGLPVSISLIFIKNHNFVRLATILFFVLMVVLLGYDMLSQYMYGS
jgi:hypothetical protein